MNSWIIKATTNPGPQKTRSMEGLVVGILLLVATIAAGGMVWTRLLAEIDQPTFEEMVAAIDENLIWYTYHGVSRVIFGGLLVAVASLIRPAMALARGWQLRVSSVLINLGGIAMISSGAIVIFISTVYWTDTFDVEQFDAYRVIAGSVGNTVIGLGILLLTPVQWRLGGLMKISAVVAPIAGITMALVWFDAPAIHRISGYGFLIWTLVTSIALITGAFGAKPLQETTSDVSGARKISG